MDERVVQAMARWPNVPACTGWLALDRRGRWRMRDEAAQAAGALGETIDHTLLNEFIGRNYQSDAAGRWFFQNGPQRVYVDLAYTPWVLRAQYDASHERIVLRDHVGGSFAAIAVWLSDDGNVLFEAQDGPEQTRRIALLHDHDLDLCADRLVMRDGAGAPEAFQLTPERSLPVHQIRTVDLPSRFGFEPRPRLDANARP